MTPIAKTLPILFLVGTLVAHEDIDIQVATITERIANTPDNPELYHKRADLHRAHEEFALALEDYNRALQLAPDQVGSHIGKSSTLLAAGKAQLALASAKRASELANKSADAHLARARALTALGRFADADKSYTRSTSLRLHPSPELFIEHATALKKQTPPNLPRAIEILADGVTAVGPLVTLISPAIDFHLESGQPQAALALLDKLPPSLGETPAWLVRRAEILTSLGKTAQARQTYRSAHQAIARLPERRRKTAAMTALLSKIQNTVDSLDGQVPRPEK